jgi:DNA polymerase-3 subunit chi
MKDKKTFAEYFECPSNRWERDLCQKVAEQYAADARVYVWASSQAEAMRIDELLWTFEEGSFIPHNLWSDKEEFREQVTVGWLATNPNSASVLVIAGEQPLEGLAEMAARFGRILDFVPSKDKRATTAARERYKALNGAGFSMRFHPVK